jgi:hypothetical protein
MRALRIALVAVIPIIWLPLAIVAGCRTAQACPRAWELPPDSLRYQIYSALAEHRVLVAIFCVIYAVAVIVVFRREIVDAFSRRAAVRVLGLVLVAIAVAAGGILLTYA